MQPHGSHRRKTESIDGEQDPPNSGLSATRRRDVLLETLRQFGSIRVTDQAKEFGISELTLRRDLDLLEQTGLIERYHGGARLRAEVRLQDRFADKPNPTALRRDAIGRKAAEFIQNDETILLNGGSTTLAVLNHLEGKRIRVVTNSVAATDLDLLDAELILLGGHFRSKSRTLFGELAALTLSQVNATTCILGANGISLRAGATTTIYSEGAINRLMAERCRGKVIVVADGAKVGAVSPFSSVPLESIDMLITDDSADPEELSAISAAGVHVVVCPLNKETI